jgi:hypothetical protein
MMMRLTYRMTIGQAIALARRSFVRTGRGGPVSAAPVATTGGPERGYERNPRFGEGNRWLRRIEAVLAAVVLVAWSAAVGYLIVHAAERLVVTRAISPMTSAISIPTASGATRESPAFLS